MTKTATRERPILMSAPMVRAILSGRKTQTRRAIFRDDSGNHMPWRVGGTHWQDGDDMLKCRYGEPGGCLWVKETWALVRPWHDPVTGYLEDVTEWTGPLPGSLPDGWRVWYAADSDDIASHRDDRLVKRWRPSIHMPRWASRITLEITGVRVERLQDISEEDAKAEGIWSPCDIGFYIYDAKGTPGLDCRDTAVLTYRCLWDRINGKSRPWASNSWVWVIEFRKVEGDRR